jgi:hypothetical protein
MASLYVKQNKLWARYKDEEGQWTNAPTPYRPGQEREAKRYIPGYSGEPMQSAKSWATVSLRRRPSPSSGTRSDG